MTRVAVTEKSAHAHCALSGPVLRDTARPSQRYPLLRAMGLLVSQHGQLGAIPPPPFLSVSPLESMRSGGAIPPSPLKGGISAILARYPMNTRQMGAIPPSAILSRKGIARYGGGISLWAMRIVLSSRMQKRQGLLRVLSSENLKDPCGSFLARLVSSIFTPEIYQGEIGATMGD